MLTGRRACAGRAGALQPAGQEDAVPRLPAVRDYMDLEVPTLRPEQDILEAIDFLIANRVTGAPVVDADGRVVGMLTEKDCLRLLALGSGDDVAQGTVGAFMTTDITTVEPRMNIYFAAGLFLTANFRRIPVVENGRLVGAITRFDLVRAVSENHKLVRDGGA
jgi:CBS domain-containing protein